MSTNERSLNPLDPVDAETLRRFAELVNHRNRLGSNLLDLKAEEVRLVVAARRIDEERDKLFEKVLTDRGIHPGTEVEIDSETGVLKIVQQPAVAAPAPEAPAPAPEAPTAQADGQTH